VILSVDVQAIIVAFGCIFVLWTWETSAKGKATWSIPDRTQYFSSANSLPDSCPAADLALSEAKDYFKSFRDSARNLDLRATGILGFVGGGTGIWAAAGGTDVLRSTTYGVLLYGSIGFLFIAIVAAIWVLRFRARGSPNVQEVLDLETLRRRNGKSVMSATLAWEFIESTRQLQGITRQKRTCVNLAQTCFVVGILLLVAGTVAQAQAAAPGHQVMIPCTFGDVKGRCTIKMKDTP
jgi:hypothetical protein